MINFPNSPIVGQAFTHEGTNYTCISIDPIVWNASPAASGIPDAPVDGNIYGRIDTAWAVIDKYAVGLGNVDNTSDASKAVSGPQQAALNTKEPVIAMGTTAQYWRGDKSWQALTKAAVGLGNVDNTADAAKTVQAALYLRSGAVAGGTLMPFTWNDDGTQPAYLWGGANANGQVYDRNRVKVGNAGNADNANAVNGISGWAYRNDANNPNYLWCTEGSGSAQHLTQPGNLSVNYANSCDYSNRTGSVNGAGGGQINGDLSCTGGMRAGGYYRDGGHAWWFFWNGDVGDNHLYAYVDGSNQGWLSFTSDERLKQDIVQLESSTEAFMKLKPINFRWKPIAPKVLSDTTIDGLSAQNVRDCFPNATFGNFDEVQKENGQLDFPGNIEDRALLAHVIIQVQSLIRENDDLKTRLAALEA